MKSANSPGRWSWITQSASGLSSSRACPATLPVGGQRLDELGGGVDAGPGDRQPGVDGRGSNAAGGRNVSSLVQSGTPYPTDEAIDEVTVKASYDGQQELGITIYGAPTIDVGDAGAGLWC